MAYLLNRPLMFLAGLIGLTSPAMAGAAGWALEANVRDPSYAVTEPTSTNLNIDVVVLTCEQGTARRGLQLRLYLSGTGPLARRCGRSGAPCARSSRNVPATCRIARICADPPTRETELPTLMAGRTPW